MKRALYILGITLIGIVNSFASIDKSIKASDEILIGYCDPNTIDYDYECTSVRNLGAAISVGKTTFGIYSGSTIKGMRVAFSDDVTDLEVFIKSSLTGDNLYSELIGDKAAGWHNIEFAAPYTFPNNNFYIGYTCKSKAAISFSGETNSNACWIFEQDIWKDNSQRDWGSLCILAIIDSDSYTKNDVALLSVEDSHGKYNEPLRVYGQARNNTASTLTSFNIEYVINEGAAIEKTVSCNMAPGAAGEFTFDTDPITETGLCTLDVFVKDINGIADDNPGNNDAYAYTEIFKYSYPKRVVVEEGTGTWCGYCPQGTVCLAKMKEKYPDTFIGIAVHSGDQMAVSAYAEAINFPNFPNCKIDRKEFNYPAFEKLEPLFLKEFERPCLFGVELTAILNNEETEISIETELTFGFNSSDLNYRIAYILMENNVTGYMQTNYYAGGKNGEMGGWENLPANAPVPFDDVARGIYSSFTGIENSVPTTVVEDTPLTHTYSIELPKTIQDKSQLELVAILIDVETGYIVNADKVHLKAGNAIGNIKTDDDFLNIISTDNNQVRFNINVEGHSTIELYNVSGKLIYSEIKTQGENTISIMAPKGVYILKANSSQGSSIKKIIL